MSEESFNRKQISSFLAMEEAQLYSSLVSPDARVDMHHKGAVVARGKSVFLEIFRSARAPVCAVYSAQKDTVKDTIDLVALVAGAMTGTAGGLAIPAAVLAVRIGLNQLCQGTDKAHD